MCLDITKTITMSGKCKVFSDLSKKPWPFQQNHDYFRKIVNCSRSHHNCLYIRNKPPWCKTCGMAGGGKDSTTHGGMIFVCAHCGRPFVGKVSRGGQDLWQQDVAGGMRQQQKTRVPASQPATPYQSQTQLSITHYNTVDARKAEFDKN